MIGTRQGSVLDRRCSFRLPSGTGTVQVRYRAGYKFLLEFDIQSSNAAYNICRQIQWQNDMHLRVNCIINSTVCRYIWCFFIARSVTGTSPRADMSLYYFCHTLEIFWMDRCWFGSSNKNASLRFQKAWNSVKITFYLKSLALHSTLQPITNECSNRGSTFTWHFKLFVVSLIF